MAIEQQPRYGRRRPAACECPPCGPSGKACFLIEGRDEESSVGGREETNSRERRARVRHYGRTLREDGHRVTINR